LAILLVLQLLRLDVVIGSSSRRWLRLTIDAGRAASLYPVRKGHSWAAARASWCWPRPAWTGRARRAPSPTTLTRVAQVPASAKWTY